jgi:hypothetical protein
VLKVFVGSGERERVLVQRREETAKNIFKRRATLQCWDLNFTLLTVKAWVPH